MERQTWLSTIFCVIVSSTLLLLLELTMPPQKGHVLSESNKITSVVKVLATPSPDGSLEQIISYSARTEYTPHNNKSRAVAKSVIEILMVSFSDCNAFSWQMRRGTDPNYREYLTLLYYIDSLH